MITKLNRLCRLILFFIYYLCVFTIFISLKISAYGNIEGIKANDSIYLPHGACSYKIEIDNVGTIWGCNFYDYPIESTTKLILERHGGFIEVIYTFDNLLIKDIFRVDLDNDNSSEIVVILQNYKGGDLYPYIFSEKENFKCIYPQNNINPTNFEESENFIGPNSHLPISGSKISLASYESSTCLVVYNIIDLHNLGEPYLMLYSYYKLVNNKLLKVHEKFGEIFHNNQLLNRASYAFNNGSYLEAISFYEKVDLSNLQPHIQPEYLFLCAEARRFIEDYVTSERLYNNLAKNFSSSIYAKKAKYFLKFFELKNSNFEKFKKYNEINLLLNQNKFFQALSEVENTLEEIKKNKQTCENLCKYFFIILKIEILYKYGKLNEALKILDENFISGYANDITKPKIPKEIIDYTEIIYSNLNQKKY